MSANNRWKCTVDTRHVTSLYNDGDKRGAARELATTLKLALVKPLEREAKQLQEQGCVYEVDEHYTGVVWQLDKWQEIVEQFTDYAEGEDWFDDEDFEPIAEQMCDLADSVGVWIASS